MQWLEFSKDQTELKVAPTLEKSKKPIQLGLSCNSKLTVIFHKHGWQMSKEGAQNRQIDEWIEMRTSCITEVAMNGVLGTSSGK